MRQTLDPAWRGGASTGNDEAPAASADLDLAAEFCRTFDLSTLSVCIVDGERWIRARSARAEGWGLVGARLSLPLAREAHEFERALRSACEEARASVLRLTRLPAGPVGERRVELVPWQRPGLACAIFHPLNPEGGDADRRARFESVGRLASSVAHDFNNLLTGLRGSLALIRHGASDQSRLRALNAAEAASDRASELIRQMLVVARGSQTEVDAGPLDTAEPGLVVQETVQLFSCIAQRIEMAVEIEPNLGRVDMRSTHLHQVVLNLLMNARDAVRELGARARVSVSAVRCSRASLAGMPAGERWVCLTVKDNGVGIPPALRRVVFEPYFSTKSGPEGWGLGLSNVKALVERIGGWVELESEEQQGTSVHVFLPLAGDVFMNGDRQDHTEVAPQRILICDDETRLADLTAGLLEDFGYHATSVSDGNAALAALERSDAHVLLLDVNLASGLSTADLLTRLRVRSAPPRVILTSGLAPDEVPSAIRQHPLVTGYLAKPYTVEELTLRIEQALAGARH